MPSILCSCPALLAGEPNSGPHILLAFPTEGPINLHLFNSLAPDTDEIKIKVFFRFTIIFFSDQKLGFLFYIGVRIECI